MVTSLFRHERIRTTKAKALEVRKTAEKMITRAKLDSVHNRRIIGKDIKDQAVLAKVFTEIGPRFKQRPGGYTRVLKLGPRPSDAAEMVILELLPKEDEPKKTSGGGRRRRRKSADTPPAGETGETAAKAEPTAETGENAGATENSEVPDAVEPGETDDASPDS
jgi:large subunit ribosomal protein L17